MSTTAKIVNSVMAIAMAGSILATAALPARAAGEREQGGPPKPVQCIAYQHRDFKGAKMTQYAGQGWKYVGSAWNDKISSFKIADGCHVVAYHHRDFRGDSTTFRGYVKYTGDLWNDQISSWKCVCPK